MLLTLEHSKPFSHSKLSHKKVYKVAGGSLRVRQRLLYYLLGPSLGNCRVQNCFKRDSWGCYLIRREPGKLARH